LLNYLVDPLKENKKIKKEGDIKQDGNKVKKERKVYELPGQKHDPPPEV
jgi:hypothetical protein